jgi:hypothetical protein
MPHNLISHVVSRLRWSTAVLVIAVAGLGLIMGSTAMADQHYIITVDVTHAVEGISGKGIVYTCTVGSTSCPAAYHLYLDKDDTVQWQVTNGNTPKGAVHLAVLFLGSAPPKSLYAYHGTDMKPTTVLTMSTDNVTYEYYVAVFDEDRGKTYFDDPKIIVGSGHAINIDKLEDRIQDLEKRLQACEDKPKHCKPGHTD